MNYEMFLVGLVDELEKVSSEVDVPDEEDPKKRDKKDDKTEKREAPETPPTPGLAEEQKEAFALSDLERAFFIGLYDELEKKGGWRDLGAARIAKMKGRMAAGLKGVRGKALTSLKATGKTGTPLYTTGAAKGGHGKFYERYGGKGFAERKRKPYAERRTGAGFQKRVQQAVQERGMKPAGPGIGKRLGAWGAGIKQKITGAAAGARRQLAGAKGAVVGAARGAAAGAGAGREAAMAPKPVRTTAAKIPARPRGEIKPDVSKGTAGVWTPGKAEAA
jgi:hypothetical protein